MTDPTARELALIAALQRLITVTDNLLEAMSEQPNVDKALTDLHDAAENAREEVARAEEAPRGP